MKKTIILVLLGTTSCAQFERISQAIAFPAAASLEAHVGANCIRAEEAGREPSRVAPFLLRQGRELFNARHRPIIAQSENEALDRMRANTDRACPDPFAVTAPLEAAVPVTPPAEEVPNNDR